MARKLSEWCKQVQKAMIDQDKDFNDIARESGLSRTYVSSLIRGRQFSEPAVRKIEKVLGIKDDNYHCLM